MSPDKLKVVSFSALGVWVVLAGGLGYLAYDASSERAEAEETLESENESFRSFNEAAVFPSQTSIAGVKSNELNYAAWYEAAYALAGRGDRDIPAETPPVFKQRLQAAARRMQSLPGDAGGKLSQPTFFFGFEKFLGETDALPQNNEVPRLAAQLDFIEHLAEILSEAGVKEVKALTRVEPKEDDADTRKHLDFTVTFVTRPAGLVKTLNSLAADQRFIAVADFGFKETADAITPRLNPTEGKEGAASGRGRRGRRGRAAEEETPEVDLSKKENRMVTDPAVNSEFEVSFSMKVYDFKPVPEDETPKATGKKKRKGSR